MIVLPTLMTLSPDLTPLGPGYDEILIIGQSNTYAGEVLTGSGDTQPSETYDAPDDRVFQWGINSPHTNTVIAATEPLHHIGLTQNGAWVGAWLTFAKMYKAQGYLEDDRDILIVHAGEQTTSFYANDWNEGDTNYEFAITQATNALATGEGTNRLVAILWQHGEDDSDAGNPATYEADLLAMIDAMRTDLGAATVPFIAGGMVPAYVSGDADRETVQAALANIVNERPYTGYADPTSPTTITSANGNHYSGRGVRGFTGQDFNDYTTLGLAGRYWVAYLQALLNN